MTIEYNHKTDVALAELQDLVVSYDALTVEYNEQFQNSETQTDEDCKHVTAMETQNEVNKAILELLENILAPNYPGATRYRSSS